MDENQFDIPYNETNAEILKNQYNFTDDQLAYVASRGGLNNDEADHIYYSSLKGESLPLGQVTDNSGSRSALNLGGSFAENVIPGAVGDIAGGSASFLASKIPVVGPAIAPVAGLIAGSGAANSMSGQPLSWGQLASSMTTPENLVKTGAAIGTGGVLAATLPATVPMAALGWGATSAAPVAAEALMDTGKWLMGYPDENNSTWESYANDFAANLGGGAFGFGRQAATTALGSAGTKVSRQFDEPNPDKVRAADIQRLRTELGGNPEIFDVEAGRRILNAIGAGPGTGAQAQFLKSDYSAKALLPTLSKYVLNPLKSLLGSKDPQTTWELLPQVLDEKLSENGPIQGMRNSIRGAYDHLQPNVNAQTGSNLKRFIDLAKSGELSRVDQIVDPITNQITYVKTKSPGNFDPHSNAIPEYGYANPLAEARKYLDDLKVSGKTVSELYDQLKSLDSQIEIRGGYDNTDLIEGMQKAQDPIQAASLAVLQAARNDLADHIVSVMSPAEAAQYLQLGQDYRVLKGFKNQIKKIAPTLLTTPHEGGLIAKMGEAPGATSRTFIRNVADMISSAGTEREASAKASNLQRQMSEGGRRVQTLVNTLLALNGDPSAFPNANTPALPGERYVGGILGAAAGAAAGGMLGGGLGGVGAGSLGGILGYEAAPYLANGPLKTAYNIGASQQSPYTTAGIQAGIRASENDISPAYGAVPDGLRAPNGMSMAGINPDAMELAQIQTQMQVSPTTDPKAMNAVLSAIMPPRDFSNGLPRDSGQWDPKAIYQFISSVVPTGDPRAPMAKVLVSKLLSATQQGDETEKRKILTDMSRTFPDLFEPGMGIDNLLLHPEDQKKYISSMKNGLYAGTVDSHLLTQQLQRFSNPEDGGMVPYRAPIANTIRSGALLTNVTPRKIDYDY